MDPQQELLSKLIIFCIQDDGQSGSDFISNCSLPGLPVLLKVALRTFSFGGDSEQSAGPPRALNPSWNLAFLLGSPGTGFYSSKIKIFLTA